VLDGSIMCGPSHGDIEHGAAAKEKRSLWGTDIFGPECGLRATIRTKAL
jgi:hypothetical protein